MNTKIYNRKSTGNVLEIAFRVWKNVLLHESARKWKPAGNGRVKGIECGEIEVSCSDEDQLQCMAKSYEV